MGGKGKKRREKNYKAAHGGNSSLPPPPDPSSLDAVPSKLRKLMSITGAARASLGSGNRNGGEGGGGIGKKALSIENGLNTKSSGTKRKRDDGNLKEKDMDHGNEDAGDNGKERKKRKKKAKKANDLRFEALGEPGVGSSRRKERRKQRSEAKKKKKGKRAEEIVDFPGHEHIKFGDIVQAPLKLAAFPKALKNNQDASQERLRLKAVESYRERKRWKLRPGIQLPHPVTTSPSV